MALTSLISRDLKRVSLRDDRSGGSAKRKYTKKNQEETTFKSFLEEKNKNINLSPSLLKFRYFWHKNQNIWPTLSEQNIQSTLHSDIETIFLENNLEKYTRHILRFADVNVARLGVKNFRRDIQKLYTIMTKNIKKKTSKISSSFSEIDNFYGQPIRLRLYGGEFHNNEQTLNFPISRILCDISSKKTFITYTAMMNKIYSTQLLIFIYVLEIKKKFPNKMIFLDINYRDAYIWYARSIPCILLHQQKNCFVRMYKAD